MLKQHLSALAAIALLMGAVDARADDPAAAGAAAGAAYGATITFHSDRCSHTMGEGGNTNQCGEPEKPILPPKCPPPIGCNLNDPSTWKICTGATTICICTSLGDSSIFDDGHGNRVCVPKHKCQESTGTGMPNPVGVNNPSCKRTPIVPEAAIDPNDKVGTLGVGTAGYVAETLPMTYGIHFENLATATGPAAEVVITDQLDPSVLDLSTLSLGPITFGNHKLVPEAHSQTFLGGMDLQRTQDVQVIVRADLDRGSGVVTWRFSSIDATTGEITDDPRVGFLPPNVNAPAGEGAVMFTVKPKSGLATGVVLSNHASVVFDTNAPIATPTWTNTIDRDPPISHVTPLAASQSSLTFDVQWTGTDVGSGISAFDILVSDNGGPFQPWISNTSGTSAAYTGQLGHTYGFASIATDLVGNVEALKTVADTTTSVGTVAACAQDITRSVAITRSGYGYNFATRRFAQTVTLRNSTANAITGPIAIALDGLTSGVASTPSGSLRATPTRTAPTSTPMRRPRPLTGRRR